MDSSAHEDTYPMPLSPQLLVVDLAVSLDWYRALGFEVIFEMPEMAHVRYRRYADVMLVEEGVDLNHHDDEVDNGPLGGGLTVYLTLEDEALDEVVGRAASGGVEPEQGPRETVWNTVEAVFVDPDGYRYAVAEVADPTREFDEVMGSPPE